MNRFTPGPEMLLASGFLPANPGGLPPPSSFQANV
jgi:hypothetical protein